MNAALFVLLCTTAAMDDCEVWKEGEWIGAAAPVYCTAERDVAEGRLQAMPDGGLAVYGTTYVAFECDSQPVGE